MERREVRNHPYRRLIGRVVSSGTHEGWAVARVFSAKAWDGKHHILVTLFRPAAGAGNTSLYNDHTFGSGWTDVRLEAGAEKIKPGHNCHNALLDQVKFEQEE